MKRMVRLGAGLFLLSLIAGRGQAETDVELLTALNENHETMVQAFVDRDAGAFAGCWTPMAVCAVDELPLIAGRAQLVPVFMDAAGGTAMEELEKLNRRIWRSGGFAYETGVYVHRFAVPGRATVQAKTMTFVTVWQKQPDGSWARAVEAWNNRPAPSGELLEAWRALKPVVTPAAPAAAPQEGMGALCSMLKEKEKTFHDIYLTNDVEPAMDMYADDARVLSGGNNWCVGKDAIRKLVQDGRKQVRLVSIECDSVACGGNEQSVYVINRFHWQFSPVAGDGQVDDYYGKGLHVWQRQPDGEWKILIDISTTNPASGESL